MQLSYLLPLYRTMQTQDSVIFMMHCSERTNCFIPYAKITTYSTSSVSDILIWMRSAKWIHISLFLN